MIKRQMTALGLAGILAISLLSGCSNKTAATQVTEESETEITMPEETTSAQPEIEETWTRLYAEEDLDASWDPDEVTGVVFTDGKIEVSGEGAEVSGSTVTIRQAGTYVLSGNMPDGQVLVDAGSNDLVRLVLNGVEISNSRTSPIYGLQSGKIIFILEAGTQNHVSDVSEYQFDNASDDEPNAAIFSKDDLVINGMGNLTVNGNFECAIRSKDNLTVISGNLTITAQQDGLKGKDSVVIRDGNIQITCGKDGIKSNNSSDPEKGYIWIDGGQITITAQDDGIQAEKNVAINGGRITITESDEGIAGLNVDINGGVIDITAKDDGINAAATVETEREKMMNQEGAYIRITGGSITIDAAADGIDSNGDLYLEGGQLFISSSTSGGDGIIDYNGDGYITGGTLLGAGDSGMMQTFGKSSTQNYLVVYFEGNKEAGTEVSLQTEDGEVLASFVPAKGFNTVIASSPELKTGSIYTVTAGGETLTLEVQDIETSSGTPSGRGWGGGGFGGGPRGGQGAPDGQEPPDDTGRGDRTRPENGKMPEGQSMPESLAVE